MWLLISVFSNSISDIWGFATAILSLVFWFYVILCSIFSGFSYLLLESAPFNIFFLAEVYWEGKNPLPSVCLILLIYAVESFQNIVFLAGSVWVLWVLISFSLHLLVLHKCLMQACWSTFKGRMSFLTSNLQYISFVLNYC